MTKWSQINADRLANDYDLSLGLRLAQCATRSQGLESTGGNTGIQSRVGMFFRGYSPTPQFNFSNWWVTTATGETPRAAAATVTAALEYPVNVMTQITFNGGNPIGIIAPGGDIFSDPCRVDVPGNKKGWVRVLYKNSAGIIYRNWTNNELNGDTTEVGNSLTDKTMSGTIGSGATNSFYFPTVVACQTRLPAVYLAGDSLMKGAADTTDDITDDQGIAARSVGPICGYANSGFSNDTIDAFLNLSSRRQVLINKYFSHIISNYGGVNDAGLGSAAVLAKIAQMGALFPKLRRIQATRMPKSTGTWDTVAAQTAVNFQYLKDINLAIRANSIDNWDDFADTGYPCESSPDSGLWAAANGVTGARGPFTADGVHPNTLGNVNIRQYGVVQRALFRRGVFG